MPVSNANKVVSESLIPCGGSAKVTLSFNSSPTLKDNPSDIILIMDRSSSLRGERFLKAQEAARKLVNMITEASGGTIGGSILKSRMALVSFQTTAAIDSPLTNASSVITEKINAMISEGRTNHRDAFVKAKSLIDTSSPNKQVVIMFTDGSYNEGGNPDAEAEEIKAMGAEIYCVGLVTNPDNVNRWATDPDSIYVANSNDPDKLNEMFERIGYEVIHGGSHDAVINEVLNPDFKITKIDPPTHGVASATGAHSLKWEMDGTGGKENELVSLSFDIMHVGKTGGIKKVNESVTYTDREGQSLTFPEPEITVDCTGPIINPESCPDPVAFTLDSCRDTGTVNVPEVKLSSLGRIVRVDTVLKNICPGKETAAAVFLTETDAQGVEISRGMKTVKIPPQAGTECMDIALKCIHFVVPEETGDICKARNFNVRVLANYTDTDFVCCESETTII